MALSNLSDEEEERLREQYGDDDDTGGGGRFGGGGDTTGGRTSTGDAGDDMGDTVEDDADSTTPDDDGGGGRFGSDPTGGRESTGDAGDSDDDSDGGGRFGGGGDTTGGRETTDDTETSGSSDDESDAVQDPSQTGDNPPESRNEPPEEPAEPPVQDPVQTGDQQPVGAEETGGGVVVGGETFQETDPAEQTLEEQIASGSDQLSVEDIDTTIDQETGEFGLQLTEAGQATIGQSVRQQAAEQSDRLTVEDIEVDVSNLGTYGIFLNERGADRISGATPQKLGGGKLSGLQGGDVPTVQEAATEVEQKALEETAAEYPTDVVVDEDTLEATLTSGGVEKEAAASLGVSRMDIEVEDGQIIPQTKAGEEALEIDTRPTRGGGTGQAEAAADIERQLEEQTGTELDREDIAVEADGDVVRGALSQQGERTVAAERTPFQDTPISGLLETGARLDVRGSQFREENVERAQEATGIEELFAGEEPFLDAVEARGEQLLNIEPADILGSDVEAPDVTGGTLPVFSGAGGGTAGISRGAAAAGAAIGTGISAGAAALEGDTPTARAEVPLPESGEPLVQDEVTQPTRPGIFQAEVPIPDPMERPVGPLGVPELGITIGTGEEVSVIDTTEIPTEEPVTTTELDMEETESESFVKADTATETGGTTTGDTPSPSMPGDSLPTPGEVGGESSSGGGGGFNIGRSRRLGQAKQVGRTFDEDKALTDTEELFLGIGAETPSSLELIDFAQQAQAGADAGSGLDSISTPLDADIADAEAASESTTDAGTQATPTAKSTTTTAASGTATGTGTGTGTGTPNIDVPKFEFDLNLRFNFGAPTITSPGVDVPGRIPRAPLPDSDPTRDDSDDDRRRSASEIFDNPALAPDELGEFEEQLFEDLE